MKSEPNRARAWASVAGLSIDQLFSWGVLYYAYSVLSAPIATDLGVSNRFVAGAFSCTLLVSSLLARALGRLMDRSGARPVLVVGALVGPILFGVLAGIRGELLLLLAFASLGIAQSLSLYEPAFRAVVDWFPLERERSLALLLLTSVAGFASTVFLPLTALLLARFGWRSTVVVLAVLLFVVTIPVRLALLPRSRTASKRGGDSRSEVHGSPIVGNVLGAGFALQTFASTGATVCLVWHLVERGQPLHTASLIAGLVGAAQVPGRLLLAPLQQLIRIELRLPLLFLVQGIALAGIAFASGPALAGAVFFFGAAGGIMTLERATVVLEWFGPDSFGARSGHIASLGLVARAAGPFLVELLHGSTRYAGVFGMLAVGLGLGGVVVAVANRLRAEKSASFLRIRRLYVRGRRNTTESERMRGAVCEDGAVASRGNPTAIASLREGETVVDLGSGAGFDCFLAARRVGASGHVIGVEVTPPMISKARANAARLGTRNVEFRLGELEHLPVADASADVVLSNCVVNVSPDKALLYRDAFRVLRPGGRIAISDIVLIGVMPAELEQTIEAWNGCISSAPPVKDVEAMLADAGFVDIRVAAKDESQTVIEHLLPGMGAERAVALASIEAVKPGRSAWTGPFLLRGTR